MAKRKLFFAPTFTPSPATGTPNFGSSLSGKKMAPTPKVSSASANYGKGGQKRVQTTKTKGSNMNSSQILNVAATAANLAQDPNVRQTIKDVKSGIENIIKPGSNSGSNGQGYLSNAPNPAETKLNTGLPLTLLEKNYTSVEENVCSSLHLTQVLFTLPVLSSSIINTWYTLINTRDYQSRVQEQVNWQVDITTKFSATNITTAMNALYKALQIYYFYRSVDAYTALPTNQNDGMYALRSEFDFDTYYRLSEIERLLARTPLPPNMNELCRFLFANYFSGETPNSPLIKLVPFNRTSQAKYTSNTTLDGVITDLSTASNIDVWTTLGRVCKNWVPGTTDKIFDPPLLPEYNRDFVTIFNNIPSANGITGKTYSPNATNNSTNFTYLSWTNQLDGAAVAFTDCYNTTTSAFPNGLITVPNVSGVSRFSYYIVSGVKGFYGVRNLSFLKASRLETYDSDGTTETTAHRFGSDMIINVSAQMISTTAINLVDWMLSSSEIKSNDVQRTFAANPKRRRSK